MERDQVRSPRDFAQYIAEQEGGAYNLSIAQIEEVLRIQREFLIGRSFNGGWTVQIHESRLFP